MLFTRVVLAATVCAGSVLASSSGSANIAARALHTVVKRDAADDFAAAQSIAMGLAQSAGEAVASGGKCSTECNDWVSSMGKCLTASSVSESANCVCADTAITQMGTCGDCLGGDNKDGAGSLSKLCSEYAAELSGSSTTDDSSTTAATSTTPAAESSVTSAASSAASGASDALTSAQSAASSVASSAAADATGAPASGAGKLTVGGSAILAAGAALLVAL